VTNNVRPCTEQQQDTGRCNCRNRAEHAWTFGRVVDFEGGRCINDVVPGSRFCRWCRSEEDKVE